jgi:uncharacterized protein (DUF1684 family)
MPKVGMTKAIAFCLLAASCIYAGDEPYVLSVLQWRQKQDQDLRAGPLRVIARFKLDEGSSTVGSDPASVVVLPSRAPKHVAKIVRHGDQFSLEAQAPVVVNDKPEGSRLNFSFGDFTITGARGRDAYYAVVADAHSSYLEEFKGRTWFPVDTAYRVEAQFSPYEKAKTVSIPFTMGGDKSFHSTGEVVFQIAGQTFRLQSIVIGDELFVMFRDETSGRETYGAGRYIEAPLPRDGKTLVDFNKAYNPDCAFNPNFSCPLPLPENRLPVRVTAGETYQAH